MISLVLEHSQRRPRPRRGGGVAGRGPGTSPGFPGRGIGGGPCPSRTRAQTRLFLSPPPRVPPMIGFRLALTARRRPFFRICTRFSAAVRNGGKTASASEMRNRMGNSMTRLHWGGGRGGRASFFLPLSGVTPNACHFPLIEGLPVAYCQTDPFRRKPIVTRSAEVTDTRLVRVRQSCSGESRGRCGSQSRHGLGHAARLESRTSQGAWRGRWELRFVRCLR